MGMIAAALYHSLVQGIKIWHRVSQFIIEEDIALFLDRIEQDLQNSFVYSQIQFRGRENRLAFPAIIKTRQDPSLTSGQTVYVDQMGQVEYYFEMGDQKVYRREANYSQALNKKYALAKPLTQAVKSLDFRYYLIDEFNELTLRRTVEELPAAIRIEINYTDTGGHDLQMVKTVNIPLKLKKR